MWREQAQLCAHLVVPSELQGSLWTRSSLVHLETCETLRWTFKASMLCLLSTHYSGLLLFTCTHKIALTKVAYKQSCREANQEGLLPYKKFQMGVVETAWKGSLRESPRCRRNNSAEQADLIFFAPSQMERRCLCPPRRKKLGFCVCLALWCRRLTSGTTDEMTWVVIYTTVQMVPRHLETRSQCYLLHLLRSQETRCWYPPLCRLCCLKGAMRLDLEFKICHYL